MVSASRPEADWAKRASKKSGWELRMDLETKYQAAQSTNDAIVGNIRRACAEFMRRHSEYIASQRNEQILFAAMSSPENDHLSPTSVASWEDVYAQCREQLDQRPVVRRQVSAAPVSKLTVKEIDGWTAKELQRQIESSPRRAAEIELALSRNGKQ